MSIEMFFQKTCEKIPPTRQFKMEVMLTNDTALIMGPMYKLSSKKIQET